MQQGPFLFSGTHVPHGLWLGATRNSNDIGLRSSDATQCESSRSTQPGYLLQHTSRGLRTMVTMAKKKYSRTFHAALSKSWRILLGGIGAVSNEAHSGCRGASAGPAQIGWGLSLGHQDAVAARLYSKSRQASITLAYSRTSTAKSDTHPAACDST